MQWLPYIPLSMCCLKSTLYPSLLDWWPSSVRFHLLLVWICTGHSFKRNAIRHVSLLWKWRVSYYESPVQIPGPNLLLYNSFDSLSESLDFKMKSANARWDRSCPGFKLSSLFALSAMGSFWQAHSFGVLDSGDKARSAGLCRSVTVRDGALLNYYLFLFFFLAGSKSTTTHKVIIFFCTTHAESQEEM